MLRRTLAPSEISHCRTLITCYTSQQLHQPTHAYGTTSFDQNSSKIPGEAHNATKDADQHNKNIIDPSIRSALLAEEAMLKLFQGQEFASGRGRPDVASFKDQEQQCVDKIKQVARDRHTRPSALLTATNLGFFTLGSVAALLPPRISASIVAGMQSAVTDEYNEQLRMVRECGLAEQESEFRQTIRELRDTERTTEGAPSVPDITSIPRLKDLSPEEGVAALSSAVTKAMMALSKTI